MLTLLTAVKTQHFLGAVSFERASGTEVIGTWQVRAWHVRTGEHGKRKIWDVASYLEFTHVETGEEGWKIGVWRPHTLSAAVGEYADVIGDF